MAGSLTPQKQAPVPLSKPQKLILDHLADGMTVRSIVQRLAKGDPVKASRWRQRIRRWANSHPEFREAMETNTRAEALLATGPVVQAQIKRACRGRVDSAKLVLAISGFHNDRIDHKHSGKIELAVSIPRPPTVQDQLGMPEEEVVEADVVEEP